MSWYVKAKDPDGTIHPILCDDAKQVADAFNDQRRRGRKVWIEETDGKAVAASRFGVEERPE